MIFVTWGLQRPYKNPTLKDKTKLKNIKCLILNCKLSLPHFKFLSFLIQFYLFRTYNYIELCHRTLSRAFLKIMY